MDVFASQAKLDAFGAKLMPILKDMGIETKPTVFEVRNNGIDRGPQQTQNLPNGLAGVVGRREDGGSGPTS